MRIDRNNYEAILLDYLDGNLNAGEVVEVLLFLEQNPQIKEELEGLSKISIPDEMHPFDSSSLHKPEYAEVSSIYERLLTGKLEGDLDLTEQQQLKQGFRLYPELHHEDTLFAQTKLTADPSEIFAAKHLLKKGNILVLYRRSIIRIAAILLLVSGIGFAVVRFNSPGNKMQVVSSSPTSGLQHQPKKLPASSAPGAGTIIAHVNTGSPAQSAVRNKHHSVSPCEQVHHNELEPTANNPLQLNTRQLAFADLPKSSQWIEHGQPAASENNNRFISLPAFLRQQFTKETRQLEQKTITAIQDMNKTAGVTITKDSSGRITHFEIVALGIEWSQTK